MSETKCRMCGLVVTEPSLGGADICPSCDCGHSPVEAQRDRIRELETALKEAEAKQRVDQQQCEEATDAAGNAAIRIRELEEACRVLGTAVIQLRGALTLDHMVQNDGSMYGTTVQALESAKAVDAHPIASRYVKEQP